MYVVHKAIKTDLTLREIEMIEKALELFTPSIFKYSNEEAQHKEARTPARQKKGRLWEIYDRPTQNDYSSYKDEFNNFLKTVKSRRFNTRPMTTWNSEGGSYEVRIIEKDAEILITVIANYLKNDKTDTLRIMGKNEIENKSFIYKHTVENFLTKLKEIAIALKSQHVKGVDYV